MIDNITTAAESVGITAVVTNSTEKIETQLNRITRDGDLPLMLVSWDMTTSYSFNDNGFLNNPVTDVTILLMDKAESKDKEDKEATAVEMESLFQQFIQSLRDLQSEVLLNYTQQPVFNIQTTLAPHYGLGVHSGVLGTFSMYISVSPCS